VPTFKLNPNNPKCFFLVRKILSTSGLRPAATNATVSGLTSPMTRRPRCARQAAVTDRTYPSPKTLATPAFAPILFPPCCKATLPSLGRCGVYVAEWVQQPPLAGWLPIGTKEVAGFACPTPRLTTGASAGRTEQRHCSSAGASFDTIRLFNWGRA